LGRFDGRLGFQVLLRRLVAPTHIHCPQAADFVFELLDADEGWWLCVSLAFISQTFGADAPKQDQYMAEIIDICQCLLDRFSGQMLVEPGAQTEVLRMLIDRSSLG
jgi:hypothetical protein